MPVSIAGMMIAVLILSIFPTVHALGWFIYKIMSHFLPDHFLGIPCLFYKDLLYGCLSFRFFILYIRVARKYKFCERSDIVPIHLFAKNYYEKEHLEEKEYLDEVHSDRNNLPV